MIQESLVGDYINHFESGNDFWINIKNINLITKDDIEALGVSSLFVQFDESVDAEPTLCGYGNKIGEILSKEAAIKTLSIPCIKGHKRSVKGLKNGDTVEWEDYGFYGGEIDHQTITKINEDVYLYTSKSE